MKNFKLLILALLAAFVGGVRSSFATANDEGVAGTHEKAIGRYTDAAIATRHLLFKKGSDNDHIAVSGAADVPQGTVADEADAAEKRVNVQLLGKGPTKRMIASAAIAAGVRVYTAAAGKIQTAPSGATVSLVGVSVSAASADGDVIEVNDCVPVSVTFA